MSEKVAFAIILAFVISFSIFTYVQSEIFVEPSPQNDFYSKNFDNSKSKILLIGSSYVGMLNATVLENTIKKTHSEIQVFNLAKPGDKPKDRLPEIEKILKLEPEIVVYGIGFRAFSSEFYVDNGKVLPDPEAAADDFFNSLEIDFLENPKFNTLSLLRDQTNIGTQNLKQSNTPFFDYTLPMYKTNPSLISDKHVHDGWVRQIPPIQENIQYDSLKKIISKLNQNGVKVIIFVTPHNHSTIDSLSNNDKENFQKIISEIESNQNVSVYSLLQNYSNLDVWTSPDHITISKKGYVFIEDVSKFILKEMSQ